MPSTNSGMILAGFPPCAGRGPVHRTLVLRRLCTRKKGRPPSRKAGRRRKMNPAELEVNTDAEHDEVLVEVATVEVAVLIIEELVFGERAELLGEVIVGATHDLPREAGTAPALALERPV